MNNAMRRRVINLIIFMLAYGLFLSAFWDDSESFAVGGARGMAIGIPLVLATFAVGTVYYTRKNGGDWAKVRTNLKHNFLTGLSFTWKDKGSRRTKK